MGTVLIIKNADFSANGISIPMIMDIVDGSINTQSWFFLSSSNIKVRCSPVIKVGIGETIVFSMGSANIYQGYKPGYVLGVWNADPTNMTSEQQKAAAVSEDCRTESAASTGTLDEVEYTNNNDYDVWVTVSVGFNSAIKPSDFNISDYKTSVIGKISAIIS